MACRVPNKPPSESWFGSGFPRVVRTPAMRFGYLEVRISEEIVFENRHQSQTELSRKPRFLATDVIASDEADAAPIGIATHRCHALHDREAGPKGLATDKEHLGP